MDGIADRVARLILEEDARRVDAASDDRIGHRRGLALPRLAADAVTARADDRGHRVFSRQIGAGLGARERRGRRISIAEHAAAQHDDELGMIRERAHARSSVISIGRRSSAER